MPSYYVDPFMSDEADMTTALKWFTEPPKEPGWYWAIDADIPAARTEIVEVVFDDTGEEGGPLWVNGDIYSRLSNYSHWLGPLPVPEPPKESENK